MRRPASEEQTGDVRPASPGSKALGAMELAARRAREAGPGRPPGPRDPEAHSGPDQPTAWIDPREVDAGPEREPERAERRGFGTLPPERWLALAVALAALLVIVAAVALGVSLSSGSGPGVAAPPPARHGTAHTGGTPGHQTTGTQPNTSTTTSSSTTSTLPSLGTPGGAPVIASLNPSSGNPGQTLQVSGSNFLSSDGQIVATFAGQVAPTSCPTQTTCTVTVPSGPPATGAVPVTITTSGGTSNTVTFTYG